MIGAGYDWQFAPVWVAGVFGDFDISSLKGTIQDQAGATVAVSIKQTSAWAAGPRLGWLPSPQTMTYVNGGYTGARFSGADHGLDDQTVHRLAFSTPAFTASGWFVGGGVETTFDFFGMSARAGSGATIPLCELRQQDDHGYIADAAVIFDITFKPTVQTVTSSDRLQVQLNAIARELS